ncbi:MAG: guanylate kinase [Thermodesulfobacteriota bacterium]|nr:guanylate kinase [Thermodesulfobacteriota bacterium]
MPYQPVVISAPSGAGKSTIINALKKRDKGLAYCVSHTSRKPRNTEKDGIDYHFVDRYVFERMIEEDSFVEWAEVYNDYYGTSFSSLEEQMVLGVDVLMDVDSQGAKNIKSRFIDSVLIYVLPPSLGILEERLKERGTDNESVIRRRMAKAFSDIKNCVWYDYIVINNDIEEAIGEVQAIIVSQRCRTARRMKSVEDLFDIS